MRRDCNNTVRRSSTACLASLSLCPHSLAGGADREQMDLQTLATTLMFALVAVGHSHRSHYICSLARMRALGMFPGVP